MGPWMHQFPGTLEAATFDPVTLLTHAGSSSTAELCLLWLPFSTRRRGMCVQVRETTLIQLLFVKLGEVFANSGS